MPNPHYVRSRRKEQELVRNAKKEGKIALRSAGSKSPIDVVEIDHVKRIIYLYQVKTGNLTDKQEDNLYAKWGYLYGDYNVRYKVCHYP